jgi:hypothetical protein
MKPRAQLNMILRSFAKNNNVVYGVAWSRLYAKYKYFYQEDLELRARNRQLNPLDLAEKEGHLERLLSVAKQEFKIN